MKEITVKEVKAIEDYLKFTNEQKKAITNLKKAFTRCRKLGLAFWDNYGELTAYDSKKMSQPVPDEGEDYNFDQGENYIQCGMVIKEAGDTSGNADDGCLFSLTGKKTLKQIMKDYYYEDDEE